MAVSFTSEHKRTSEYRFFPEDIKINAELNGRFDKPEIEWLITDILKHGQHTPVAIRNNGGEAVLVAGFSRWRAISEINNRNLAPVKMQVRCTYIQCNEPEAFLHNISENRFRNPTTPLDDAHNIKRLMNVYAMTEEQVIEVYFPIARTDDELKVARKFISDRIALISLTPEAAKAVRSGRVKENAAAAIAKLSQEQQSKALEKEGTITRSDVVPAKPRRISQDQELTRRVTAVLEDIYGLLDDTELQYVEVERILLLNLHNYMQELKKTAA